MICRRCLQRSTELIGRASTAAAATTTTPRTASLRTAAASIPRSLLPAISSRATTPAVRWYSSSPAPGESAAPTLSTPLGDVGAGDSAGAKPKLSSCPEGTILQGLNYIKGKNDPVALADEAYPEWLWSCLDVTKKADDGADEDAGDEFCMFLSLSLLDHALRSAFAIYTCCSHRFPLYCTEQPTNFILSSNLQQSPRSSASWQPAAFASPKSAPWPRATWTP